jgi:hypothetical protein
MEEIELKNSELMLMLDDVMNSFENLTFDNFDDQFPKILNQMELVHHIKSELLENYGIDKLIEFEPEAHSKAKIIEELFNETVKIFSEEDKRIKRELASSMNKKKLNVYNR